MRTFSFEYLVKILSLISQHGFFWAKDLLMISNISYQSFTCFSFRNLKSWALFFVCSFLSVTFESNIAEDYRLDLDQMIASAIQERLLLMYSIYIWFNFFRCMLRIIIFLDGDARKFLMLDSASWTSKHFYILWSIIPSNLISDNFSSGIKHIHIITLFLHTLQYI